MSYLIAKDFNKQIQSDNLNQVIGGDTTILYAAELTAFEEAKSYLVQKYDTSSEFQDLNVWASSSVYNPRNRVYLNPPVYNASNTYALGVYVLNATQVYKCSTTITVPEAFNSAHWLLVGSQYDIYNAVYPQPLFSYSTQYAVGDKVYWNGKVYTCLIATQPLSQSSALQYYQYQNLPYSNVAPDNVNQGLQYWGSGTAYTVPANIDILNTTYWAYGDNRSQQMVTTVVDITLYHLHSRISPRNIPDLRVKRYDESIKWLIKCAKGEVTPNLPVLQPTQGGRVRYGGNIKQINSY